MPGVLGSLFMEQLFKRGKGEESVGPEEKWQGPTSPPLFHLRPEAVPWLHLLPAPSRSLALAKAVLAGLRF